MAEEKQETPEVKTAVGADTEKKDDLKPEAAVLAKPPVEVGVEASVESISVGSLSKHQHPNDVRFKVNYAKDFKGTKTFVDGSVQIVSKESAEHFAQLGYGQIIK